MYVNLGKINKESLDQFQANFDRNVFNTNDSDIEILDIENHAWKKIYN